MRPAFLRDRVGSLQDSGARAPHSILSGNLSAGVDLPALPSAGRHYIEFVLQE